ncbi:MAG: C25 family cysteine peptidase, partial [Chitinophagaceae bacterium]
MKKPQKNLEVLTMIKYRFILIFACFSMSSTEGVSQRTYSANSLLSTGAWYKLSINDPGIYKIDISLFNSLGINTSGLASNSIRIFGNGGQMLAEANAVSRPDDLVENAIMVVDGGDGIINGSDYILFYANGPDEWVKDSANASFSHRKNLYSEKSFYFLNIGVNGKRIFDAPIMISPNITVTSFSERNFHEINTVNFLGSGKEWYGEELSGLPGRSLTRNFTINIPGIVNNAPLMLRSNCVARSVGVGSRFEIRVNSLPAVPLNINSISGGQYDLFAQQATNLVIGSATSSNISVNYTYFPGSLNAQGWINWFELFTRRNISLQGINQLLFRDWPSVGNNVAEFVVTNASTSTQVWDITDPLNPLKMPGNFVNNEFHFVNNCARLREYIAFNPSGFLTPVPLGKISNQDLHNTTPVDLFIVSHPSLLLQAERLAQLHLQQNGLRTKVVTTDQIFNEFGSGSPDPSAIRDFVKMYHDKYGANSADKPRYLLLFGDASYDYKNRLNNNTNLVPAYENNFALDPLSS